MIFTHNDKEFKLVPRTRKVIDLTEKLKTKNLNELIFNGLADGNLKVLAELIKSFAEYEDGKPVFTTVNNVYDFIDKWKEENQMTFEDLYKDVAEVVNEMGFFKRKMSPEELKAELQNPAMNIDFKELMNQSAQKMTDKMIEEEFRGHLG